MKSMADQKNGGNERPISDFVLLKGIPRPVDPLPNDQAQIQPCVAEFLLSIPPALLRAISEEKQLKAASDRIMTAETQFSDDCTARLCAGFWYGRPIFSPTLQPDLPVPTITKGSEDE